MATNIEIPEPFRGKFAKGDLYYTPRLFADLQEFAYTVMFRGDEIDKICMMRGMCHLTKEAAEQHAKALIAISGGKIEQAA